MISSCPRCGSSRDAVLRWGRDGLRGWMRAAAPMIRPSGIESVGSQFPVFSVLGFSPALALAGVTSPGRLPAVSGDAAAAAARTCPGYRAPLRHSDDEADFFGGGIAVEPPTQSTFFARGARRCAMPLSACAKRPPPDLRQCVLPGCARFDLSHIWLTPDCNTILLTESPPLDGISLRPTRGRGVAGVHC